MTIPPELEHSMRMFHDSLSEKDRRRYAAIEAATPGHGGIDYISTLLGCDPKTVRQGRQDLEQLPDDLGDRVRKKAMIRNRAKIAMLPGSAAPSRQGGPDVASWIVPSS